VKKMRKVAALVVVLLGVAALLFALRSCSPDDDGGSGSSADPTPSASASPSLAPTKMTTTRIEQSIKTRLDQNAGQPTRVECPDRVLQKIGTAFDCQVFFANQPNTAAVAVAAVKIDGPDGHFTWNSKPVSQGE
jgi:hypothetical protein